MILVNCWKQDCDTMTEDHRDGELIGMVHSVYNGFHHITLSTTYKDLVKFIQDKVHKYIFYKSIIKKINFTNPNIRVVPK